MAGTFLEQMMTTPRGFALAAFILGAAAVGACSESAAPAAGSDRAAAASSTKPPAQTAPAAAQGAAPIPATIADLFPPGAGREAVLNNCGSCHNLACSTIGQRMAARWDALKESHKEKVSDADLDAAFAYLRATFNDSRPEPKVPPKFLEGGCTPF
jgi:mono/diheme cytochrome c family protein